MKRAETRKKGHEVKKETDEIAVLNHSRYYSGYSNEIASETGLEVIESE